MFIDFKHSKWVILTKKGGKMKADYIFKMYVTDATEKQMEKLLDAFLVACKKYGDLQTTGAFKVWK